MASDPLAVGGARAPGQERQVQIIARFARGVSATGWRIGVARIVRIFDSEYEGLAWCAYRGDDDAARVGTIGPSSGAPTEFDPTHPPS